MAASEFNRLLQQLDRTLPCQGGANLTDGQLLGGFIERRDETAFATLVQRHGPMVLGVCLRVLRHRADAEDAFQATFLVLVRKAATVVPREMVANWLHGVAYQTAVKARAVAARRRTRERQVTTLPEPAAAHQPTWDDWRPLLDEELSRLPDRYRVPVILCDLEGKTRLQTARLLGLPEGTVSSRLSRARALLARRLTRRGITWAGGLVAAECLPARLVASTTQAAVLYAAGGEIAAQVAVLTEGVLYAMWWTKLKTVLAVLVILGGAVLAYGTLATGQTNDSKAPTEKPSAQVEGGAKGHKAQPPAEQKSKQPQVRVGPRMLFAVNVNPEEKLVILGEWLTDQDDPTGQEVYWEWSQFSLKEGRAFWADGKRITEKDLWKLLPHDPNEKMRTVLLAADERALAPEFRKVLQPDTILLIGDTKFRGITPSPVSGARKKLLAIDRAIQAFHAKHGGFPKSLMQLAEGETPLLKASTLIDPWEKFFQYDADGPKNFGKKPDVWTVTSEKKLVANWQGSRLEKAGDPNEKTGLIYKLKKADAAKVAAKLVGIFGLESRITITVDDRANTVYIRADSATKYKQLQELLRLFDEGDK